MQIKYSQLGYSLTELIVTTALLALVIGTITTYTHNQRKIALKEAIRSDRLDIESTLKNRINCLDLPITCTDGDFLTVNDKGGGLLVADADVATPTSFDKWKVKLQCQAANGIHAQIARTRDGSTFSLDPINPKKPDGSPNYLDWNHDDSILLNRELLCNEQETVSEAFTLVEGSICTVTGNIIPPCITAGGSDPNCPCPAPNPGPCPGGTVESHIIEDSFGGGDNYYLTSHGIMLYTHGRQKIRYCAPN